MTTRICLVGAGFISQVHARAIADHPGLSLAAIVDTDIGNARQVAAQWGAPHVYSCIEEAMERPVFDRAHVLVPPPAHTTVALPFLNASFPVLVEKPLGVSAADAQPLLDAAERFGARLGVNQNALFHPAFRKLMKRLADGEIGRLNYIDCLYNVPLRQLQTQQFGHWMFAKPQNILLEQAVHPLSQILSLSGPVNQFDARAGPAMRLSPGISFYPACDVVFQCAKAPAHFRFAVGGSYPVWRITVVGSDGEITADMIRNRTVVAGRSRWLEAVDDIISGFGAAGQMTRQATANGVAYGLSTTGLAGRSDPFFQSMTASIAAFHSACDGEAPLQSDGPFGLSLVSQCDAIAQVAMRPSAEPRVPKRQSAERVHDVAILGGTGFIGRALVTRLLTRHPHLSICVMARHLSNLPDLFHRKQVDLVAGDVTAEADVARAIGSAPVVINLAHGGGGDTWSEIERRMVGSAEAVATACLARRTELLIHVSSIAALYLGDASQVITGLTQPDPMAHRRSHYARAKAMADQMLMDLNRHKGLPVCILRPGLVVGEGGSPFHSGLGVFNNEQHCLGWNGGRNPLPFVLVDDVADAIIGAMERRDLGGVALNLVGDVRLTARDYIDELATALGRPLRYHGQMTAKLQMVELCKWGIKRLARRPAAVPSYRDLLSRGLLASFDCSDAKKALDWAPVSERQAFVDRAIRVHAARTNCCRTVECR